MGKLEGKAGWAAQAAWVIHVDVAMAILCHWQFEHKMQWKVLRGKPPTAIELNFLD